MGTQLRQIPKFFTDDSIKPEDRRAKDLKEVVRKSNPNLRDEDLNRSVVEVNNTVSIEPLKYDNEEISKTKSMAHLEIRVGFDFGSRSGFTLPNLTFLFLDNLSSDPNYKILYMFEDVDDNGKTIKNIQVKLNTGKNEFVAPSEISTLYQKREIVTYTFKHPKP